MSKKLINGLKYEKLAEEELYDLSQWELVDIILAYREDLKAKEQECEELKHQIEDVDTLCNEKESLIDKCLQTLTEIKEIAEFYNNSNMDDICYQDGIYEILQKISEVEDGSNN